MCVKQGKKRRRCSSALKMKVNPWREEDEIVMIGKNILPGDKTRHFLGRGSPNGTFFVRVEYDGSGYDSPLCIWNGWSELSESDLLGLRNIYLQDTFHRNSDKAARG